MRTDRFVPDAIDAQFWELMADAGPQLAGKGDLGFVFLRLVRMGGVGQARMKTCRVIGERDVGMVREKKTFRT